MSGPHPSAIVRRDALCMWDECASVHVWQMETWEKMNKNKDEIFPHVPCAWLMAETWRDLRLARLALSVSTTPLSSPSPIIRRRSLRPAVSQSTALNTPIPEARSSGPHPFRIPSTLAPTPRSIHATTTQLSHSIAPPSPPPPFAPPLLICPPWLPQLPGGGAAAMMTTSSLMRGRRKLDRAYDG